MVVYWKKGGSVGIFFFFVLLTVFFFFVPSAFAGQANATSCGDVNESITLSANIVVSGRCFNITKSNITLDGGGFIITGNSSGEGVFAEGGFQAPLNNLTIKNFAGITNFTVGIYLSSMRNITIFNNTINGSDVSAGHGVHILTAENSSITFNVVRARGDLAAAIRLDATSSTNVTGNNVSSNASTGNGIQSINNAFFNSINKNVVNATSVGISADKGSNITSNSITSYTGQAVVAASQVNVSFNVIVSHDGTGVSVTTNEENVTIENNNITLYGSSDNGVSVGTGSPYTKVLRNRIVTNDSSAVGINLASNNVYVMGNVINTTHDSLAYGILFNSVSHSLIDENVIFTNGTSSWGIEFLSTGTIRNNTFVNNNITAFNTLEIDDRRTTRLTNYFIYNNSFGEIRWTDNSSGGFLNNFTFEGPIGLGINLFIDNNTLAVNTSAFANSKVNSAVNITFFATSLDFIDRAFSVATFNISRQEILAGTRCDGTSCTLLDTTLSAVIMNVSSLGSFTLDQYCNRVLNANFSIPVNVRSRGTCFTVNASNIVIEGFGNTVTGAGSGFGVNNTGFSNVTIRNFAGINNFSNGIYFTNAENNTIVNNTIKPMNDSSKYGIYLLANKYVGNISFNSIVTNGSSAYGIFFSGSNFSVLEGNNISATGASASALAIANSLEINITRNTLSTSGTGEGIEILPAQFIRILFNNITNSGSGGDGIQVNSNVISSQQYNVTGNNISVSGANALSFVLSSFLIIDNNVLTATQSNSKGITFTQVSKSNITRNTVLTTGSADRAIDLVDTQSNLFEGNVLQTRGTSDDFVILLRNSVSKTENNTFLNNNLSSNASNEIEDLTGGSSPNYLVYSTLFGEVSWQNNATADNFVENLTLNGTIGSGINLFLGNGTFALNVSAFTNSKINSGANITLRGAYVDFVDRIFFATTFNTTSPETILGGTSCNSTSCFIDSYSDSTLFFNVTQMGSFAVDQVCNRVLNQSFTLPTGVFRARDMCFSINASHLILDGNGSTILGNASAVGINNTDFTNVTIRNFAGINNFSKGIYFDSVENNTIVNNTINPVMGSSKYGIHLSGNKYTGNISFNSIVTNGTSAHGIFFSEGSNFSVLEGNNISANGTTANALFIANGFEINITRNTLSTSGSGMGIRMNPGQFIRILFNNITTSGSGGGGIQVNSGAISSREYNVTGNNISVFGANANVVSATSSSFLLIDNNVLTTTQSNTTGITFSLTNASNITRNTVLTTGSADRAIDLVDTQSNLFEGNVLQTRGTSDDFVILLRNSVSKTENNTFLNNNLSSNASNEIEDLTGGSSPNYLVYSTLFGEVSWQNNATADNFVENLTLNGTIGSGINLFLGNGTFALNVSAFTNSKINSTANITLRTLSAANVDEILRLDTYNTTRMHILRSGTACNGTSCLIQSYSGGVLIFNTSSPGSFTAFETACGVIPRSFTLRRNILSAGSCFEINASHVVIDSGGFSVFGNSLGAGINITAYVNVTIRNFANLSNFTQGVWLVNAENITVTNVSIVGGNVSNEAGVFVSGSTGMLMQNSRFDMFGFNATGILSYHTNKSNIINNTFNALLRNGSGIVLISSHSNNISLNTIQTIGQEGKALILTGASNNTFAQNILSTTASLALGVHMIGWSENNTFNTNNISAAQALAIHDESGTAAMNFFLYENAQGIIRWIDDATNGFLRNLTLNGSIALGTNLFIGSNIAALNTSAFTQSKINSSANITLFGLSSPRVDQIYRLEAYSTTRGDITAGTNCNGTSCLIFSYAGNTLIFNTSFFSSFTSDVIGCGTIASSTTLVANVSVNGSCFIITGSHLILNGNDFAILGNGTGIGLNATGITNVTIRNLRLFTNFSTGIFILNGGNVTIFNNSFGKDATSFSRALHIINASSVNITKNSFVGATTDVITIDYSANPSLIRDIIVAQNEANFSASFAGAIVNVDGGDRINITGNTFLLTGTSSSGIDLTNAGNASIIFNNITGRRGSNPLINFGLAFGVNVSHNLLNGSYMTISTGKEHVVSENIFSLNSSGLQLSSTNGNLILNNIFIPMQEVNATGIEIANSLNNTFVTNNISLFITAQPTDDEVVAGIYLSGASGNNTFLNNYISAGPAPEIVDKTNNTFFNYLIYNNSFGEIRWTDLTDNSFLKNLTLQGNIGLGVNLLMQQDLIALNTSAFGDSKINSTANITLRGVTATNIDQILRLEQFVNQRSAILGNGTNCNGTTCLMQNFANGVLTLNTSFFSSFTYYEITCGFINRTTTLMRSFRANTSCFIANMNNIIIDGNGYVVAGNASGYGVDTNGFDNITVRNFGGLNNFSTLVYASGSENITITNNNFTGANISAGYGVHLLSDSFGSNISVNKIIVPGSSAAGILLATNYSTLNANNITTIGTGSSGLYFSQAHYVNVSFNTFFTVGASGANGVTADTGARFNALIFNNITIMGVSNGLSLTDGAQSFNITRNNITVFATGATGVFLQNVPYNVLKENHITSSGASAVAVNLTGANSTNMTENRIVTSNTDAPALKLIDVKDGYFGSNVLQTTSATSYALFLTGMSVNNTFLNNNLTADAANSIEDRTTTSSLNYLIYNNSFGEIRWINTSSNGFLENMTVNGPIGLGINLLIGSNLFALNLSAFSGLINSSANVTLRGLSFNAVDQVYKLNTFANDPVAVTQQGTNCNGTGCSIISYNAATGVLFLNISGLGSYAVFNVQCGAVNMNVTLSRNFFVNDSCFVLNGSNMVFDGNGFSIQGNGSGMGINATNQIGFVVKGLQVVNFSQGIIFVNTTNSSILNGTITFTTDVGLLIDSGRNTTVTNLTITQGNVGVQVKGPANPPTLEGLIISNMSRGIFLQNTNSTLIRNAHITNTTYGVIAANTSFVVLHGGNVSYAQSTGVLFEGEGTQNNVSSAALFENKEAVSFVGSSQTFSTLFNNTIYENVVGIITAGQQMMQANTFFNHTLAPVNVTSSVTNSTGNQYLAGPRALYVTSGAIDSKNDYILMQGTALFTTTSSGSINFTNVTIGNVTGEIQYPRVDIGPSKSYLSEIRIFNRTIIVDSAGAPELNRSAVISFFNIGLANPVLLRDGSRCNATHCSIMATTPTFKANVTSFSNYTVIDILDLFDSRAPAAGQVFDGPNYVDYDYTNNVTTLYASWLGAIDTSKISYKYQIFQDNVLFHPSSGYVQMNDSTQTTVTGVSLSACSVYKFVVVPTDAFFNEGTNMSSNGITVDTTAPGAPSVSSTTHPTEGTNYTTTNLSLSWTVPTDGGSCPSTTNGFSFVLDQSASTVPDTVAEGNQTLTSTTYTNLGTGTWYFHIRARDVANNWGSTTTFQANILSGDMSITLRAPESPTTNTLINLTGSVSRNTTGLELLLNDVVVTTTRNNATLHFTFENISLTVGLNKLVVRGNISGAFTLSNTVYVRRLTASRYNVSTLTILCTSCSGGTKHVKGGGGSAPLYGAATQGSATAASGSLTVGAGQPNFIFVTKANAAPLVTNREEYLINQTFLDLDKPTFGHTTDVADKKVGLIIEYPDITVSGDDERQGGRYNLIIKNNGIGVDGKLNITVDVQ